MPLALAMGAAPASAAPSSFPAPYPTNYCPNSSVVLVDHSTGAYKDFTGATALQDAITAATSSQPTTTGSGSGDTVIACPGTYHGPISIAPDTGGTKDNVTVRSFNGPHDTVIVGDGSATPVVSIDANGVNFGGPALGFTIKDVAPTGTNTVLTAIQVGIQGAQVATNEDETCTPAGGVGTVPGCDQNAPQGVTVNDRVVDNVISTLVPAPGSVGLAVTGIQVDNTMNTTLEQNLLQNVVPDHATAGMVKGIVVGGITETAPSPAPSGFMNGTSTNVNVALLQNAVTQLVQGANSTCTGATAVTLDGYVLDATVYNNLIQQLVSNASGCSASVTGITSNAFGSLENEQTGTLIPINANIDDNMIGQLGPKPQSGTAVYLAPDVMSASAGSNGMGSPTCVPLAPGQNQSCTDTVLPSAYTVVNNEIQHVQTAVDVEAVLGSNSYIRNNNFDSDIVGVKNGATVSQDMNLDATNDWWGCPTGPANGGLTPTSPPTAVGPGGCAYLISPAEATSWEPPLGQRVEQAGDEAGDNAGQN